MAGEISRPAMGGRLRPWFNGGVWHPSQRAGFVRLWAVGSLPPMNRRNPAPRRMVRCYGSRCGTRGRDYPLNRLLSWPSGHTRPAGCTPIPDYGPKAKTLPGTPLWVCWDDESTLKPDKPLIPGAFPLSWSRYAMGGIKAKVFASHYLTVLPDPEALRQEIMTTQRAIEARRRPESV